MTDEPTILSVDMIVDIMCPWCYIGKRRLEAALSERPDLTFSVRFLPYQLDPTIPEEGMPRMDYLIKKFGSASGYEKAYAPIRQAAIAEGLDFNLEKIQFSPNTINSHRLLRWSHAINKHWEMLEGLFKAYFCDGKDLNDIDVLLSVATECGMDASLYRTLLNSDTDKLLIHRKIRQYVAQGIQGVPCLVIGGKFFLVGAQEKQAILQQIDTYHDAVLSAINDDPDQIT